MIMNDVLHIRLDASRGMGSFYIYKVPTTRVDALNASGAFQMEVKVGSTNRDEPSNRSIDISYNISIYHESHLWEASASQGVSLSWTKWGGPAGAFGT